MFKPNYGQQRADRQSAQNARREQKLKGRQEAESAAARGESRNGGAAGVRAQG